MYVDKRIVGIGLVVAALATTTWVAKQRLMGPTCECATVRETDGPCPKCKVGYLGGLKIASETFFEALDAHGHEIDTNLVICESCKKALAADGFCDICKIGFVRRQAYFSKLSHLLARGELKRRNAISCPDCLRHANQSGWCEKCQIGMVGFHAYKDKTEFTQTAHAMELLVQAIPEADRCMMCALAIINDGPCLLCKVSYSDGKKTPLPP